MCRPLDPHLLLAEGTVFPQLWKTLWLSSKPQLTSNHMTLQFHSRTTQTHMEMSPWESIAPLVTGATGWKEPKKLEGARRCSLPKHDGSYQQPRGLREEYRDIPIQKQTSDSGLKWQIPSSVSHILSYSSSLSRFLGELNVLCAHLPLPPDPPSTKASAPGVARWDPAKVLMTCGS